MGTDPLPASLYLCGAILWDVWLARMASALPWKQRAGTPLPVTGSNPSFALLNRPPKGAEPLAEAARRCLEREDGSIEAFAASVLRASRSWHTGLAWLSLSERILLAGWYSFSAPDSRGFAPRTAYRFQALSIEEAPNLSLPEEQGAVARLPTPLFEDWVADRKTLEEFGPLVSSRLPLEEQGGYELAQEREEVRQALALLLKGTAAEAKGIRRALLLAPGWAALLSLEGNPSPLPHPGEGAYRVVGELRGGFLRLLAGEILLGEDPLTGTVDLEAARRALEAGENQEPLLPPEDPAERYAVEREVRRILRFLERHPDGVL